MKSAICTLFEGDYHYGVGALTNSLYHHGFRGEIWVGYRGDLPPWAKNIKSKGRYEQYQVAEDCYLNFLKLKTNYHLTNYKPNFMLDLLSFFCSSSEAIFYFDPDIVIKCRWSFYEDWISHGVALCEDINSPVLKNHPFRMTWRKIFEPLGFDLDSNLAIETYVNGGFIGLKISDVDFLKRWLKIQDIMSPFIGGLEKAKVGADNKNLISDPTFAFNSTDQDALNITLMSYEEPTTIIGKEGMDFRHGGLTMSHAIGDNKPWKRNMTLMSLKGKAPRLADKEYWKYTQSPIKLYSNLELNIQKIDFIFGKLLSRIL
jgi:hypothetical protein